ncbi:uncharacterized protein [Dendropsophus ebraccatus]|uniref:uncharacterized protein n=1 Tax=Dendropsophus ebraccatus TaxID=150705 RepID=UPI003831B373
MATAKARSPRTLVLFVSVYACVTAHANKCNKCLWLAVSALYNGGRVHHSDVISSLTVRALQSAETASQEAVYMSRLVKQQIESVLLSLVPCCNVFKENERITVGCLLKNGIPKATKISWNQGSDKDVKTMKGDKVYPLSSFLTNVDPKQKGLTCSIDEKKKNIAIPECMGSTTYPHIEILMPPFDDSIDANIPLVCYVSDFAPKIIQVVWLRNGKEFASHLTSFKVLSGENGLFSGTTKLNVSRDSWKQGEEYTCKVDMQGEVFMHNISKCSGRFVKPAVNLELPSTEDLMNGNGRVTCSVLGTNLDTYTIFLNFDNLQSTAIKDPGSKENVAVYSRSVTQSDWKSVKKVSCVAQSPCPMNKEEVSKQVDHALVEISSPIIQIIASCENGKEGTSTLICLVSDFRPRDASILWLNNGHMVQDKDTDFTAMLNGKNNKYFGKSEISITKWNEKDTYTCKVTHQGKDYLQNITKCSACFKKPVVDLTLPSSEDFLKGNAKIICSIQVSNLEVDQVSLKFDNKDIEMKGSLKTSDNLKDNYIVTYTVNKNKVKGVNTVTCVVKRPCTTVEMSKSLGKIIDPRSPDILTSSGNTDMVTGTIPLLCAISDYWPQNATLVWLKNGKKLDEKNTGFISLKQENGMYSGKSLLNVSIESWNIDTYKCCVTHLNKEFTEAIQKPQVPDGEILKPSFRELFLNKNAPVSCRTNMVHADIQWILNEKATNTQPKQNQIMRNTTLVQSTMTVSLRDWKKMSTLSCKINPPQEHLQKKMTIVRAKDDMKVPTIRLLSPDEETKSNTLKLICLVMDFYPEDLFVTWKINDALTKEDVSNSGQISCNHNVKQCTAISQLVIQKSEWLKGVTYSCLVAHISSDVYIIKNITGVPKKTEKIIQPRSPDILTSSGNTDMVTGTIPLLCAISNFWPQNANLVWLKNGKKLDEKNTGFTSIKQENGMYSGKSLLNVSIESWNIDTYKCCVTHLNKEIIEAIQKPQVPDGEILKPSFRELFLFKNASVSCRTNMVHADIQWILNEKATNAQAKQSLIIHNTTWVQSTMTVSLRDWKEMSTLSCKINPPQEHLQKKMTIVRAKDDMKVPTIRLLPPDEETRSNTLKLICLVMDFYPEDLFVTWMINDSLNEEDSLTEEDISNFSQVSCNHNVKQCTAISELVIQKSKWLKGVTYSCLVAHISSDVYIIKNISGVPNKPEEPFVTAEPDVQEPTFSELLLSKNATVNCRTRVGIKDINWLSNETDILTPRQRNDERTLYKDMESVQATIQIPLEEWNTNSTQLCNEGFYSSRDANMIKQPKVYLLPPVIESKEEEHLTLICVINGFYPEDVIVTWKINDTAIKQDFPQQKEVFCDPQEQLCTYVSHLPILKEEWLGGISYSCLVAHFSSKYYISSNISKPNDIDTVYEDDEGEELREIEEINNMWTTTSTFIALFLVTLIYSSFVTFVKVK